MQADAYDDGRAAGEFPEDGYDEHGRSRWRRVRGVLSTVLGATVAMALLVALGVWFYRLGVRDAQNVPIIRAAVEPAKERPRDPGGLVTPHQEIRSYEVAEGAPSQAAAVVLAPEAPRPDPADVAMGELTPVPRPDEPAPAPEAVPETVSAVPPPERAPDAEVPGTAEEVAAAEGEADGGADAAAPAIPVAGGTPFAPSISPVALARPDDLKARTLAAEVRDRQRASDIVAAAAQSRVQVQLAADPDEAVVRSLWSRIQRENNDLLRDRALAVQTTQSGGTTFYRLRVGPFRDAAEARSICQALKARGQDCIVARNG